MEVVSVKKRGRPRGSFKRRDTERSEVQTEAFPSSPSTPAVDNLEQDATEKEKVKRAAALIPEIFKPEQVEWVFDVYVGILSFAYSLALKVDFKEINDELEFSKEQKEGLSKPLANILSKYAPSEWAGRTDEIQLITMMGIWTVTSFKRAKNVQEKMEEKRKDAERTQPVQPIRADRPVRGVHV